MLRSSFLSFAYLSSSFRVSSSQKMSSLVLGLTGCFLFFLASAAALADFKIEPSL